MKFILVSFFSLALSACALGTANRTPAGDIYKQRVSIDLFACGGSEGATVNGLPFDFYNKFYGDCAPEVLYTWISQKALSAILNSEKKSIGLIEGNPSKQIYTVRTPLASHAYGDVSLRLKLRPNIKFIFANYETKFTIQDDGGPRGPLAESKPIRECNHYREKYPDEYERLVIASTLPSYDGFSEYIICSDKVIQSWSYGTKPHLHEMQNEFRRYKSGEIVETLMDSLTSEAKDIRNCPDAKPCSEADLVRRIQKHSRIANSTGGQIFYFPGSLQTKLDHFWTRKIFYFSLSDSDLANLLAP